MWLILFHNWRPTFQAIFNLRTLGKLATWELILLTWCWLHSKGLMRMDHSDMKLEIHRATAPQRNHVAFAAKKEENRIILFFFITSSFGIKEYPGIVINNHSQENSQPPHTPGWQLADSTFWVLWQGHVSESPEPILMAKWNDPFAVVVLGIQ